MTLAHHPGSLAQRYEGTERQNAKMATVRTQNDTENLLTPSEVATLFRVDPKTVTRWAKAGKLASIRTLGGHRRYRESEVRLLLEGNTTETLDA